MPTLRNLVRMLLVATPVLLVAVDPTMAVSGLDPAPGHAKVENNLVLDAHGHCVGNVSIYYAPKSTAPIGRVLAWTRPDCSVEVVKEMLSPQTLAPSKGDVNVTATYQSISAEYLWIDGRYSLGLDGCPQTFIEDHGQTPPYVPASVTAEAANDKRDQSCSAAWRQKWRDATQMESPTYSLIASYTYVNGGGLAQSYYFANCRGNPRTMDSAAVTCTKYPAGLPLPSDEGSPYTWADPISLGETGPGETRSWNLEVQ